MGFRRKLRWLILVLMPLFLFSLTIISCSSSSDGGSSTTSTTDVDTTTDDNSTSTSTTAVFGTSLFSLPSVHQEITSFCSLLFGFKRPQYITSIGLFYKKVGVTWRVSDCEELVGRSITGYHQASLMIFPRKRNLRVCVDDGLVRSSKDYSL